MKKNYYLMLFALAFFLLGCREELDYVNNEGSSRSSYQFTKDNVKTQILHKSDYESRSFLKPNIELFNTFLQQNEDSASGSLSKDLSADTPEIYTDVFEEVNYLNAKYYSFYVTEISSDGFEKKIILKYIDNKLSGKYILKYKRLNDFKIDPNSFQLEKLIQSSNDNENSLITSQISLSVGCTNYTITTFNCGHEGNHSNGEYCSVDGIYMPYDVVSSVYTANCQPGTAGGTVGLPGDGSGGGIPTGGGPLDGGLGNDQTPEIITLPTTAPLYIIQRPKGIICNTLNLNNEEITQINSNYNVRLRIYQYLALSGINPQLCDGILTPEAEDFVKTALQYFKNHPNTTWEDYYNEFLATPCEKLKTQSTNVDYKAKIEALDKSSILSLKKETGFSESKSGVFAELLQAVSTANSDAMTVTVTPSLKGYIHTHVNDYLTGNVNENNEEEVKMPIRMFSPADVNTLMTMAQMATNGDYSQLYGTMVSSYGNYTIMFTGTASDIKTGFDTEQWTKNYVNYRILHKFWSFEKLFLNFLKEEMNVHGVELYKIKSNGTVQKKTLNSNNNVQSSDCPQ
ncbi:hypothetical protein QFZ37_000013 [Chryseobacterium ginsenosidimutans]|uniref:hypothetical protein n=1 Tax=Chryseobacterium ginsenosidimutans TaxID=687846 RepID=UPI0027887E2C|nr:hypothetical protein [Chryseobacterium ginsenosidimutans]MDQ0591644.1 hypothetical protein [Chryseobacterium ginsenosidimutans]